MSLLTHILRIINPPEALPRLTPAQEILRLGEYLRVETQTPDGFELVAVGTTTPAGAQAMAPWIQLDAAGRPTGIFINVSGQMKRIPFLQPGDIILCSGKPSDIKEPWHFCDGTGGTPDLRSKMLALDGTDASGTETLNEYMLAYKMWVGYA